MSLLMCDLKNQIKDAQKSAMRAKDKTRLMCIRLILAEIKRVEIDERTMLEDQRVLAILDKMLRQRRDAHSQFEAAGRADLAKIEKFEISVIETFLPSQLTTVAVSDLIDSAVVATGAKKLQDMGKVMNQLKPQLQGRADMSKVSEQVKARLR